MGSITFFLYLFCKKNIAMHLFSFTLLSSCYCAFNIMGDTLIILYPEMFYGTNGAKSDYYGNIKKFVVIDIIVCLTVTCLYFYMFTPTM